jgi:hypothetical protein
MADLHLPTMLTPLFADLPRRLDVDAPTVGDAITRLEESWPGVRDRLSPGRSCGGTFTSTSTASARRWTRRSRSTRAST